MNKQIEIYLHGAGTTQEKIISISEEATVHDLLKAARESGFDADSDAIITLEDSDEALAHETRLCDHNVKHKHHLHCHRCHKVEIAVSFNGPIKTTHFPPGTRAKSVLKWAVHEFGLHGVDSENKELRLGGANGVILQAQQHIGSFVHAPDCRLALYLTAIVEVQG
jgi:hypothetical protein